MAGEGEESSVLASASAAGDRKVSSVELVRDSTPIDLFQDVDTDCFSPVLKRIFPRRSRTSKTDMYRGCST